MSSSRRRVTEGASMFVWAMSSGRDTVDNTIIIIIIISLKSYIVQFIMFIIIMTTHRDHSPMGFQGY